MLCDPIADMLTRIRNALMREHRFVDINRSKMNKSILVVLKDEGFIANWAENSELRKIRVYLKYDQDMESLISGLKRVSKPGRRIYVKHDQVPILRRGLGLSIVSTSKGIMSGRKARKEKIGGELVCSIW